MILVEECKLRLDDSVDWLLPELADRKVLKRLDGPLDDTVPANRSITVCIPSQRPRGRSRGAPHFQFLDKTSLTYGVSRPIVLKLKATTHQ